MNIVKQKDLHRKFIPENSNKLSQTLSQTDQVKNKRKKTTQLPIAEMKKGHPY